MFNYVPSLSVDMTEQIEDQSRVLDKFLVDNRELEELSARLSVFNILRVLRVEQTEIRHSNVLAWLLDPRESHGLRDAFLRRFLSTVLLDNESAVVDLTPARVELMEMLDVEVWREWKNIDILAVSSLNQWVLLVENKIKAGASKSQLVRYVETVKKEFAGHTIVPLLLTLDADDGFEVAEEAGFICWSHAQLYDVVSHVTSQRQDRIPQGNLGDVVDYVELFGRVRMFFLKKIIQDIQQRPSRASTAVHC